MEGLLSRRNGPSLRELGARSPPSGPTEGAAAEGRGAQGDRRGFFGVLCRGGWRRRPRGGGGAGGRDRLALYNIGKVVLVPKKIGLTCQRINHTVWVLLLHAQEHATEIYGCLVKTSALPQSVGQVHETGLGPAKQRVTDLLHNTLCRDVDLEPHKVVKSLLLRRVQKDVHTSSRAVLRWRHSPMPYVSLMGTSFPNARVLLGAARRSATEEVLCIFAHRISVLPPHFNW
mmetsp:Transcript_6158/g.22048  ORF Transcript_6158/g.22048 Transcript_6158/m.22048 type:complete len:230 (-) Transcript_6158:311-1000(-)